MSSFTRQALGLPAMRSERERWLTETWLAVRESRRRAQVEAAEMQRLADLPRQQAELLERYEAMDRDPFAQRIRAEAAQAAARRRAARDRQLARAAEERAREARAEEILRAEYGREAVRAAGYGRDIARQAALGVPLAPADCSFVHPHSGSCQARTARLHVEPAEAEAARARL